MYQSPWAQPSYKKAGTKKKAKKKAKPLPVAKPKPKKKKRAKAATCEPTREPQVMIAPKRGKRAGKVKASTKKVKVSAKCFTRKKPKPGNDPSGQLWPKCEHSPDQREAWEAGLIPTAYPDGKYKPGSSPPTKKMTTSKEEIPKRLGDPDLRWFVDQAVAGNKAGKIVVAFSGGKDSLACLLYVIECCIKVGLNPSEVVECWHHSVDGRPWFFDPQFDGRAKNEFDWPVTEDYCRAVCACLEIPLYFSWRVGGLMGEVLKGGDDDPLLKVWPTDLKNLKVEQRNVFLERWGKPTPGARFTAPMVIEMPDRRLIVAGGKGKKKDGEFQRFTRRSFPVPGGILSGRWCSSVAKIDVGRSQLRNRPDLMNARTLFITGERAEESTARSKYFTREFEKALGHGAEGRHVERWRPVLKWCEIDVWAIIARWQIRPHPAYQIGWGRLSCMTCIFGSNTMWASVKKIDPARFQRFVEVEEMLQDEKQAVLAAAKRLPRGKLREDALAEAGGRIAWIDKYEPLSRRTEARWRNGKRYETKLYRELLNEGRLDEFPYEARVTRHTQKGDPIIEVFDPAEPFKEVLDRRHKSLVNLALGHKYTASPIMSPWQLPAGAFGESSGPT